jgi:2-polyprenyl-3-methyl-5-hydroxy-6-metoxy-1,4-benzoquinol methylase
LGEPQPHVVVSLIAISTIEMPRVISAAASQLMRPGTRTGDSGMNRQVANAAMTITISGIQNSQW